MEQLQEGGFLILSTPNINSLRNRIKVPLGHYPAGLEYKNNIHHVRLYNLCSLKNHLREHGFEVPEAIGVNFLPARLLTNNVLRALSDRLANALPQLCSNFIVVARRKHPGIKPARTINPHSEAELPPGKRP